MQPIYLFSDYRKFLKDTIASRPAKGRGELQRIAKFAGIHSSILSQVFQGKRELTSEQAASVAHYLELSEPETTYFLLLTQSARAGTERLRKIVRKQLDELKAAQTQIASRVKSTRSLSHEEKAIFYSSWFYSAIRVLSALPEFTTKEALRKKVRLSPEKFRGVLGFLLENGLCLEENGKISPGPLWTHLEGDSPLVARHHANWRIKAMEKHPSMDNAQELAFTSPMALSKSDAQKIRARLVDSIDQICKIAAPSESEAVYFLNVDWLEL